MILLEGEAKRAIMGYYLSFGQMSFDPEDASARYRLYIVYPTTNTYTWLYTVYDVTIFEKLWRMICR